MGKPGHAPKDERCAHQSRNSREDGCCVNRTVGRSRNAGEDDRGDESSPRAPQESGGGLAECGLQLC
jgi:hypothetical protein